MLPHQLLRWAHGVTDLKRLRRIWAKVATDARGPFVFALGADRQVGSSSVHTTSSCSASPALEYPNKDKFTFAINGSGGEQVVEVALPAGQVTARLTDLKASTLLTYQ